MSRIRKYPNRNWKKEEQLEYENMKLRIENKLLKKRIPDERR